MGTSQSRWLALAALSLATFGATLPAHAQYAQTNLVSNIPGLAAITDPMLANPWGISRTATSPFWTSNQGTNTSTLYAVTGATNVSKVVAVNANGFVSLPTFPPGPQGPTGQVANTNTSSFIIDSVSARFIFADLNGSISGWIPGALSTSVKVLNAGAVYTGLAIDAAGTRLYAANNASGKIEAYDSNFAALSLPGRFNDPNLPSGLSPFNVQDIGGKVYVTYAPVGVAAQRAALPGQGLVDVFDENGVLQQRLINGSALASPWGLALAPAGFGAFAGDLLVGNFSFASSVINAFDPTTGALRGSIPIDVGAGNAPGGLWGMMFGSGAGSGGDANTLYVLDGIDNEQAGLFLAIQAVPEPDTLALVAVGLAAAGWRRRKAQRS